MNKLKGVLPLNNVEKNSEAIHFSYKNVIFAARKMKEINNNIEGEIILYQPNQDIRLEVRNVDQINT